MTNEILTKYLKLLWELPASLFVIQPQICAVAYIMWQ